MQQKGTKRKLTDAEYYDSRGVLKEILHKDIELSLDEALRLDIIEGKRKRKLRNILHKDRSPVFTVHSEDCNPEGHTISDAGTAMAYRESRERIEIDIASMRPRPRQLLAQPHQ